MPPNLEGPFGSPDGLFAAHASPATASWIRPQQPSRKGLPNKISRSINPASRSM